MNGDMPPADEEFKRLSRFILESLKALGENVKEISRTLVEVQVSIATRTEIVDALRSSMRDLEKRVDAQDSQIAALTVKASIGAFIAAAAASFLIKKLGG